MIYRESGFGGRTDYDAALIVIRFVASLATDLGRHPSSATIILIKQLQVDVCPMLPRIIEAVYFEMEQARMGVALI